MSSVRELSKPPTGSVRDVALEDLFAEELRRSDRLPAVSSQEAWLRAMQLQRALQALEAGDFTGVQDAGTESAELACNCPSPSPGLLALFLKPLLRLTEAAHTACTLQRRRRALASPRREDFVCGSTCAGTTQSRAAHWRATHPAARDLLAEVLPGLTSAGKEPQSWTAPLARSFRAPPSKETS